MPGWFITAIIFLVLGLFIWVGSLFADRGHPATERWYGASLATLGLALICLLIFVLQHRLHPQRRHRHQLRQADRRARQRCGVGGPGRRSPRWTPRSSCRASRATTTMTRRPRSRCGWATTSAFVESNLNWRIKEDAAGKMFQDYRTFDNIRQNLVDKQLQVALTKEFATFNPQQQTQGADLPGIAGMVKHDLQNAVGTEIEILLDVRIPGIFYDSPPSSASTSSTRRCRRPRTPSRTCRPPRRTPGIRAACGAGRARSQGGDLQLHQRAGGPGQGPGWLLGPDRRR